MLIDSYPPKIIRLDKYLGIRCCGNRQLEHPESLLDDLGTDTIAWKNGDFESGNGGLH